MDKLEKLFPDRVTPVVREDEHLALAPASGVPVTLYAPDSTGASDYRAVVGFLCALLRK
jgi:cellulose biosynthesis protein BcsQ